MTGRNVSGIREFGGSRVAATRSRSVLSEMEIHPYHLGRVIGTEMCHRAARNNKSISTSDTLSLVISGGQSHRGSNKFEERATHYDACTGSLHSRSQLFSNSRLLASTRLQYFTVVLTKAVKTFEKGKCVVSTGSLVHVDRVKPRISQGSRGIPMTNNPLHSWNSDTSVSRPRQHSEGASSVLDRDSCTFSAGGSALLGYQGRFVGSVCLRWIGPES